MLRNTAGQYASAYLVSRADGSDITTGTVTVYVTLDNGSQTSGGGGAATHKGRGQWQYAPTQAETDAGSVDFLFTHASALSASLQVYPLTVNTTLEADVAAATVTALATPIADIAAVKVKTDTLTSIDGGTVSASPTPTTTTFRGTGSGLHPASGGYSPATNPQRIYFTSGVNQGLYRTLVATTGHIKTSSNHDFTVSVAFPSAPASADTFEVI